MGEETTVRSCGASQPKYDGVGGLACSVRRMPAASSEHGPVAIDALEHGPQHAFKVLRGGLNRSAQARLFALQPAGHVVPSTPTTAGTVAQLSLDGPVAVYAPEPSLGDRVLRVLLAPLRWLLSLVAASAGRLFLYVPTWSTAADLVQGDWKTTHIDAADGVHLAGLVRTPEASDGAHWVLFFGGNAMGLRAGRNILKRVAGKRDVGLATFAYRGYDDSTGLPAESALKLDARRIMRHLRETQGALPGSVTIIGQSLGSGVAADLASYLSGEGTPPRKLVLVSPYTSIERVVDEMMPYTPVGADMSDKWHTDRVISGVKSPIVLVHGENDTLISAEHSRDLKRTLGDRARLIVIPKGRHNNLWNSRSTRALISDAVF